MEVLSTIRMRRAASAIALIAVGAFVAPARSASTYSQDAVKAAYLYRFTQYIEWPGSATAKGPFTIAVMGSRGVAAELKQLLPNYTIRNAAAQVREISRVQDLGAAQMLYIAGPQVDRVREAISVIAGRPVLVVTDTDHGLLTGSVLNFVMLGHRVKFEVSLPAADRSQLRISAELLGVASRVQASDHQSGIAKAPANHAEE